MRAPDLDPELVRLEEDVRAIAPQADPAFLAALEERVAAGFPRPERARRGRLRGLRGRGFARPLAVAAAALAALVVAAIVLAPERRADQLGSAGGGAGSGRTGRGRPGVRRGLGAAHRTKPARGGSDQLRPGSDPAATGRAPEAAGRRVERAAQLTLTPPADEVQSVADGVTRTTQELGGYVESSQVTTNGDGGSGRCACASPPRGWRTPSSA